MLAPVRPLWLFCTDEILAYEANKAAVTNLIPADCLPSERIARIMS